MEVQGRGGTVFFGINAKIPEQSELCSGMERYYEKDATALRPRKRLVVSQSRRERVYKRTGDANVTFCGKGGAAE